MSAWINFKELRAKLKFEAVLQQYGVEVKRKGNQHHGYCPLPNHNGKRNSPSFSAELERGIFQCFGCGAKGNILEFAVLMENKSVEDGAALRAVAVALKERFHVQVGSGSEGRKASTASKPAKEQKSEMPVMVNAP